MVPQVSRTPPPWRYWFAGETCTAEYSAGII